jgi:hypothetical protein
MKFCLDAGRCSGGYLAWVAEASSRILDIFRVDVREKGGVVRAICGQVPRQSTGRNMGIRKSRVASEVAIPWGALHPQEGFQRHPRHDRSGFEIRPG